MTLAPVRALPELKTVDDVRARALLRAAIVERLLGHELYDRPADPIQRADEDQLFHATSGKDDEGHPIKEPLADDSGDLIDADRLRAALEVASDVEKRDDDDVLQDADAVLARFAENSILEAKNKGVVRFRYLESPADKLEQIDVLRELSVVDPKVKTGAKKKNRIACRGLEGILAWLDMQEEERTGRPLYETPPDILTRVERHLTQDPLREILEPGIASVRVCVQKYQDLCDQFHPNAINEAHGQPRELVDAIDEFLSVVDAVSAYYNDRIQAGAPKEPAPIDLASMSQTGLQEPPEFA